MTLIIKTKTASDTYRSGFISYEKAILMQGFLLGTGMTQFLYSSCLPFH